MSPQPRALSLVSTRRELVFPYISQCICSNRMLDSSSHPHDEGATDINMLRGTHDIEVDATMSGQAIIALAASPRSDEQGQQHLSYGPMQSIGVKIC